MPGVEKEIELDLNWYPYLKPAVSVYLVYDETWYATDYSNISPFIHKYLASDPTFGIYLPITYPSDFWVLTKQLVLIDANFTKNATDVSLTMGTLSIDYFRYQKQFESSARQNEAWGLQTSAEYDEYKRIWLETDPTLFAVTSVVSIFHTLFEILAFQSDI